MGETSIHALNEFSPVESISQVLPSFGQEPHGYAVRIWLLVRDSFGSQTTKSVVIEVRNSEPSEAERIEERVDHLLQSSLDASLNGDTGGALNFAGGLSSLFNQLYNQQASFWLIFLHNTRSSGCSENGMISFK